MKFPKNDFAIGIYSHKAEDDPFHAEILGIENDQGRLGLEELECLYTPVNEIVEPKGLVQCSGETQILQHLRARVQVVPPFRVYLQSKDAELFFQSETHFEEGRNDRCLHIHPGDADVMAVLKQLHSLFDEICGNSVASAQLTALQQLSEHFKGQYDIKMVASRVFLEHIDHNVDAQSLWNDVREILHGGKIPKVWPCRKNSYMELQLTHVTSGLFYSIAFETKNILTAGNRRARRGWVISERLDKRDSSGKPAFQSDDQASVLNGTEVIPLRTKSRLAECRHPFAKKILAL